MAFQTPITIGKVLERIQKHEYVLPAIQREFVWSPEQICRLFDSIMRGYPIGSFLFWKIEKQHSQDFVFYEFMTHYNEKTSKHLERWSMYEPQAVTAILDGQQRLTSLNIGLYGSHAEKQKWKHEAKASAFPVKHLYLNILGESAENELGMEHEFRFLTAEQATSDSQVEAGKHWFRVSKISKMEFGPGIFEYLIDAGLGAHKYAFLAISRLHEVTQKDSLINYFEEESQDIDKVLNVFIRVNSGGTQLSYSDLLLSIATAQWKDVEASEVVHQLVDELNDTGQGFNFSKDLVLKAGLALTDTPSIAFRVTNFNAANMEQLEKSWSAIAKSLRLAVQLIADFGFSQRTLTADSVVIPIAYYLHQRNVPDSYLTSMHEQKDRERVRLWAVRSLLKPGIWGSGLDTLLLALRSTLQTHGQQEFPIAEIEATMARAGKSLRFEEDEINDLVGLRYGERRVFPLLSLLYPGMNFKNEFHVDHIFPRSRFTKHQLLGAGVAETAVDAFARWGNQLPNLQLLEGPLNIAKQHKLPSDWLDLQYPDAKAKAAYQAWHDLGELPLATVDFPNFFNARQERLRSKIRSLLGVAAPHGTPE